MIANQYILEECTFRPMRYQGVASPDMIIITKPGGSIGVYDPVTYTWEPSANFMDRWSSELIEDTEVYKSVSAKAAFDCNYARRLRDLFLDWKNNFLTVEKFSEHYSVTVEIAELIIQAGRASHEAHCEFLKRAEQEAKERKCGGCNNFDETLKVKLCDLHGHVIKFKTGACDDFAKRAKEKTCEGCNSFNQMFAQSYCDMHGRKADSKDEACGEFVSYLNVEEIK